MPWVWCSFFEDTVDIAIATMIVNCNLVIGCTILLWTARTILQLLCMYIVQRRQLPSVLWHSWASEKASGLYKLSDEVLVWLSAWSVVQIICIQSSWCHCHLKTPSPLASFKSRLVLPFWYCLTQVVLEKSLLNGCGVVVVVVYRYGDSVDNTVEENSSVFSLIWMCWLRSARACCSKTFHQQNPLNWRCRLMQVDVYNGFKMVVVVVVYRFVIRNEYR